MQIIGGTAKGFRLRGPGGGKARPIPGNIKKSLFDILTPYIPGSRCLDLFAGTGAIGIEALSRGAQWVTFVECSPRMIRVISGNLDTTGFDGLAKVIRGDVRRVIASLHRYGESFQIIFMDPPYGHGLASETLDIISANMVLDSDGIIVSRHETGEKMPKASGALELTRQEKYGDNRISFYMLKK